MIKTKNIHWFYAALIVFAIALPFSEALISISGVLLLLASILDRERTPFSNQLKERKGVVWFMGIYLIYLVGFVFTRDLHWGLYDLQKNLPYLIIPLAFLLAKPLRKEQIQNVLKIFVVAVAGSAAITMLQFYLTDEVSVLRAQEAGFIHHIRFSFQVIFSIIILTVWFAVKRGVLSNRTKKIAGALVIFFLLFLIWHQSLTGIFTFMGTALVGIFMLVPKVKSLRWRRIAWVFILFLLIAPVAYLSYAISRYYDIDVVDETQLEQTTAQGNTYQHDLNNQRIENGHYVGLYWCEKEMKQAWNKRANLKYEDIDRHGYQVKHTLVRYLTSKDLRKDAEGVEQLTDDDIRNIEMGVSNYILANKGLSLYPRLYTTIWELDTYFKTGYANHQSISQRIEYTKAALTIIKDYFWFGVGTGNWKTAYREAYEKNQSQMDPARYGDAHNQYLNYMVKFGLIGLLWIVFVIAYPVVISKAYRNPLFLLFLVSMIIANLGDSNFETHVGSSYFALFYCLFLTTSKQEDPIT